jgi:ADP-ribosylglycohydrolase
MDEDGLTVDRPGIQELLGLATGDALATTLELTSPWTFKQIKDTVGGGPFNLKPSQWADDTCTALCLAESLIKQGRHLTGAQETLNQLQSNRAVLVLERPPPS